MNWMQPTLFNLGWFDVRRLDVFLLIGLFFGLFVFWRKIKYDSEYDEGEAFDSFLVALAVGWLAGRVIYILLNFEVFGVNPLSWINIIAYPGFNELGALLVSGLYLRYWSIKNRFDEYQMLDFWATAATLGLCFYQLGYFVSGLGFGYETEWVVGMSYPGVMTRHHPVQLYGAVFYLLLFIYLVRVEYKYRTYAWYKNGRSAAENGFILAVFLIGLGGLGLAGIFWQRGVFVVAGIDLDWLVYGLVLVFGGGLLWLRSGRRLFFLPGYRKSSGRHKRKHIALDPEVEELVKKEKELKSGGGGNEGGGGNGRDGGKKVANRGEKKAKKGEPSETVRREIRRFKLK